MRFGLDDGSRRHSLNEVGQYFHLTAARVHQIELSALKKLTAEDPYFTPDVDDWRSSWEKHYKQGWAEIRRRADAVARKERLEAEQRQREEDRLRREQQCEEEARKAQEQREQKEKMLREWGRRTPPMSVWWSAKLELSARHGFREYLEESFTKRLLDGGVVLWIHHSFGDLPVIEWDSEKSLHSAETHSLYEAMMFAQEDMEWAQCYLMGKTTYWPFTPLKWRDYETVDDGLTIRRKANHDGSDSE